MRAGRISAEDHPNPVGGPVVGERHAGSLALEPRPVQLDQMTTALKEVALSGDIWIDKASNHVTEVDGHIAAVKDTSQTANITIKIGSPDGSVPTAAPTTFVDIPVRSIVTNLMTLIGQGLTGG